MRQMKEQQERNRATECRRNREIASLKKDQRRAEVRGMGTLTESYSFLFFYTLVVPYYFYLGYFTGKQRRNKGKPTLKSRFLG